MVQKAEINQYDFIDALRGLAILLVIATHVASVARPSSTFLRLLTANGAYGVQLFYVVSALTLFLSTDQRTYHEKNPIRNFFIRRIFRIVPLFYISIIAYSIVFGIGPNYWAPNGLKWWHYVLTLLFLNGWHPEAINAIVPLGWSITIEMSFYPLIPFLYKKIKSKASTLIFIIASLVLQVVLVSLYKPILIQFATGYIVQDYFYLWFFAQLPVFGLGILVYHILRKQPPQDKDWGSALIFLFFFLFIVFLQTTTYKDIIPPHIFYGITFVVLTLGLYFNPTRVFVNPFMQWMGKISYSLYLVHYIFLPYLQEWIIFDTSSFGKTTQFVLYYIFLLAISSGISYITYRFVEIPGMNYGKRLIRKLEDLPLKT